MTLDTLIKLKEACRKRGLTMESYLTLRAFGENPGMPLTQVGKLLGVCAAATTTKIDPLEARGLGSRKTGTVSTSRGTPDRRKVVFVLSAKGEKILKEIGGTL